MKICSKCHFPKEGNLYSKGKSACKICCGMALKAWKKDTSYKYKPNPELGRSRAKAYRENNPEKVKARYSREKAKSRWNFLLRTYNLTQDDYNKILLEQSNRCQICKVLFSGKRSPAVDHNHACCPGSRSCGKCVRSILCNNCNSMLGHAKDDIEILKSAIKYLA